LALSVTDRGSRWTSIPKWLVAARVLAAPALLGLALLGAAAWLLEALVSFAFVSDVFDGIIARRLGVATESLRRADTLADTLFYAAAVGALFVRVPAVIRAHRAGILILIALELVRLAVERSKFGRMAAYHLWSAKAWGIALFLGVSEAFLTQRPGPLFLAGIVVGIASDLEGLAVTLTLSAPHHDVPSLIHARRIAAAGGAPRAPDQDVAPSS
jgi:CDP-diacylglycerol--glycerol-3-phosphate 3-phosphatidyltransferase